MTKKNNQTYSPMALWLAWKRIFAFARPYMFRLILGLVFTAFSTGVWLLIPLGLRSLLDSVFEQSDRHQLDLLALGMLVLFVLQSLLHVGSHYWISWVGEARGDGSAKEGLRAFAPFGASLLCRSQVGRTHVAPDQ